MQRINKNESEKLSYATGLVNPKTTALFFDKIWVPHKEAQEMMIPSEVRFRDSEVIGRSSLFEGLSHSHNLYYRYCERDAQLEQELRDFASNKRGYNDCPILKKWIGETIDERWIRMIYEDTCSDILYREGFLFSYDRNEALRVVSDYYKWVGISLIPVYSDFTSFEKGLICRGAENYSEEKEDFMKALCKKIIPKREETALAITIKNIPTIKEDDLSWQQVKDLRKDKKAVNDLKRFRAFALQEFEGKSKNEIETILGVRLDDYKSSLKKHGVVTIIGSITTLLSASSAIGGVIKGTPIEIILAGVAVSAGVATFLTQQEYDYHLLKNDPIAYLYDIEKSTKTIDL